MLIHVTHTQSQCLSRFVIYHSCFFSFGLPVHPSSASYPSAVAHTPWRECTGSYLILPKPGTLRIFEDIVRHVMDVNRDEIS